MPYYSKLELVFGFALWLGLSFLAAALGSGASIAAAPFYADLVRPAWAPPGWLFGPVWTLLYAMMGFAAWLVWRTGSVAATRAALALFVIQLAINALWSWLFFAWQQGALAFAGVVLLWALVAATMVAFWRVRAPAGALLVPYLAWVSFASALSWTLWRLNPQALGA